MWKWIRSGLMASLVGYVIAELPCWDAHGWLIGAGLGFIVWGLIVALDEKERACRWDGRQG